MSERICISSNWNLKIRRIRKLCIVVCIFHSAVLPQWEQMLGSNFFPKLETGPYYMLSSYLIINCSICHFNKKRILGFIFKQLYLQSEGHCRSCHGSKSGEVKADFLMFRLHIVNYFKSKILKQSVKQKSSKFFKLVYFKIQFDMLKGIKTSR